MDYALRLEILRLIAHVRGMTKSTASCTCGRYYRLTFDTASLLPLLDKVEAVIVHAKAEDIEGASRFQLIEVEDIHKP